MLLKLNGLERDFHNVWGHCWIMDGLKKRCQLYPHPQNIPCFGAIMVPRFNKTMSFSPDLFLVLTQQDSQHIYVGWRTTGKQPRFGHVYQKISDIKRLSIFDIIGELRFANSSERRCSFGQWFYKSMASDSPPPKSSTWRKFCERKLQVVRKTQPRAALTHVPSAKCLFSSRFHAISCNADYGGSDKISQKQYQTCNRITEHQDLLAGTHHGTSRDIAGYYW